jgi:hypothetical protein
LHSDGPSLHQTAFAQRLAIVDLFISIPALQKIPDSVSDDVKCLKKKLSSILHLGDVMSSPSLFKIPSPGSVKT